MLGKNAFYIVTDEKNSRYHNDYLNEAFFNKQNLDFNKHFYVCGPDKMIQSINDILVKQGAKPDNVVFEKWYSK